MNGESLVTLDSLTWGGNNEGVDQEALNDLSRSSFLDFVFLILFS
ncbi:unnamed protein product [Cuscuta europaea]|uniref:Uncharacterized protein n=1 Tax=Cuscuta europaea TaxID=41803 RepID=A0A9P1E5F8_CUSEU|nr:unnamed protein product [Cuscuta europaea]